MITAESFLDFKFLSAPKLSPSGKESALLIKKADLKENGYLCDIYLAEKNIALTNNGKINDFCWLNDDEILFTTSDKSEIFTDYYSIKTTGGESKKYCSLPFRSSIPNILENGKWLVPVLWDLNGENKASAYRVFEEVPFWSNGNGDISKIRHSLFICEPKDGSVKRLTSLNFDVEKYDFYGNSVIFTGCEFSAVHPYEAGLYYFNGNEILEIIKPDMFSMGQPMFLDENTVFVQMKPKNSNRYYAGDLYKIDLQNNSYTFCTKMDYSIPNNGSTTDASLDGGKLFARNEDTLYFVLTKNESSIICCMKKDGVIKECFKNEEDSTLVSSLDVKNERVIFVCLKDMKLPELYELENEKGKALSNFNKQFEISKPVAISETGFDGFEIRGFVLPPLNYDENKSYPAILNIHGGPRGVFGAVFHHEMQLWAARGYFVLYCNPRGSDGRGEAFANLYGKYGDWDYVNLMEFTDACLQAYPQIDKNRLGVTGGSYGGYMTNWIIGHTDRFKVACSQRSISNWISYEGTGDISYWFNTGEHGGNFETNPQLLWDISPLKYAKNAKTPTLFIHSKEDYRCYMGEGIAMYTVLKMQGVETRLVLFNNENHNLSRSGHPRARLRRLEEIVNWMDKYLQGDENESC